MEPIAHRTRSRLSPIPSPPSPLSRSPSPPALQQQSLFSPRFQKTIKYVTGRFSYNMSCNWDYQIDYDILYKEIRSEQQSHEFLDEIIRCPRLFVGNRQYVEELLEIILKFGYDAETCFIDYLPILLDACVGFDERVDIFSYPRELTTYIENRDTLVGVVKQQSDDRTLFEQTMSYVRGFIGNYLA